MCRISPMCCRSKVSFRIKLYERHILLRMVFGHKTFKGWNMLKQLSKTNKLQKKRPKISQPPPPKKKKKTPELTTPSACLAGFAPLWSQFRRLREEALSALGRWCLLMFGVWIIDDIGVLFLFEFLVFGLLLFDFLFLLLQFSGVFLCKLCVRGLVFFLFQLFLVCSEFHFLFSLFGQMFCQQNMVLSSKWGHGLSQDGLVELQAKASYIIDQWGEAKPQFLQKLLVESHRWDGFLLVSRKIRIDSLSTGWWLSEPSMFHFFFSKNFASLEEQSVEFVTGWHKDGVGCRLFSMRSGVLTIPNTESLINMFINTHEMIQKWAILHITKSTQVVLSNMMGHRESSDGPTHLCQHY